MVTNIKLKKIDKKTLSIPLHEDLKENQNYIVNAIKKILQINMSNLLKLINYVGYAKSSKLSKIVSIGDSPISGKYSEKDNKKKQELVPLDLYLCNDCFHVQLIHVVNPDYLWSNFTFKTSRNKKNRKSLRRLCK